MKQLEDDLKNVEFNIYDMQECGEEHIVSRFMSTLRQRTTYTLKTIKTPLNEIRDITHFNLVEAFRYALYTGNFNYIKLINDIGMKKIKQLIKEKGKEYEQSKKANRQKDNKHW